MDAIGDSVQGQKIVNFRIFYLIAQMLGITIIILMFSWISIYLGGFGWSTAAIEFNWHPMLMTIGMIYLFGNCKNSLRLAHYYQPIRYNEILLIFSNYFVPWFSICQEKNFKTDACKSVRCYYDSNNSRFNRCFQFTQFG